jgi:hypothetical protein
MRKNARENMEILFGVAGALFPRRAGMSTGAIHHANRVLNHLMLVMNRPETSRMSAIQSAGVV